MIRIASCLVACACAWPAYAGSAQLSASGRNSVALVAEGLFDDSSSAEASKKVGFEIGVAGPLEVAVSGAIEQTADPLVSDSGAVTWTARAPARPVRALGPNVSLAAEGSGTLTNAGAYTQNVSATLSWTPAQPTPFLAGLQVENQVVVDADAKSVELTTAPEWVLASRSFQMSGAMQTSLKARMELKRATNAAPSAFAGFVFEIAPE